MDASLCIYIGKHGAQKTELLDKELEQALLNYIAIEAHMPATELEIENF